jgi:hypothetical protein
MSKDKEMLNTDEIKRKAREQFQKEEMVKAEQAAIDQEVKRLRLEKEDQTRKENERVAKQEHDIAIKGVRQFHGNVMRRVSQRYSADSKPFFVDKGI